MGPLRRILFCSEHCLADPASGAALSALELLSLLRDRGWVVETLCGDKLDAPAPPASRAQLAGGEVRQAGDVFVQHVRHRDLPFRIVSVGAPPPPGPAAPGTFDAELRRAALPLLLESELRRQHYDLVLTYGGGWAGRAILKIARRAAVPAAFWLRNALYQSPDLFDDVVGTLVPSAYLARHYLQTLGVRSEIVFSIVDRDRVRCPVRQPNYLTFVSPLPEKGAAFVARLASELARLRPDIDILLVEGRGDARHIYDVGLDLRSLPNVRWMPRAVDPRSFLAVTRMLLVPSIWPEPFGRVVIEAMINGIPVIASDRGGLPESVGIGGALVPLPAHLTVDNPALAALLPTASDVAPWIAAITDMWDDDDYYDAMSRKAVSSVSRFDPDTLADRADTVLRQWSDAPLTPILGPDPLTAAGYEADPDAARATYAQALQRAEELLA